MKPVAITHGCPVCQGDLSYEVEKAAYCCQNDACDYQRRTLAPDPKELAVKLTGQAKAIADEAAKTEASTAAADSPAVQVDAAAKASYTIDELRQRWNLSEAGVRMRLVKYGKLQTVSRTVPIPAPIVAKVEKHVASWDDGPKYANQKPSTPTKAVAAIDTPRPVETVRAIVPEPSAPSERALVATEKPIPAPSDSTLRISRLRLTLERIADLATNNPMIAQLARLALDLDVVEG